MLLFSSLFQREPKQKNSISTILDMVIYTAGLASDPTQIDTLLDTVRSVTSFAQSGQPLSPADESKLVDTYLKLEQYLTVKDPVRTFQPQELRRKMSPELAQQVEAASNKVVHTIGGV